MAAVRSPSPNYRNTNHDRDTRESASAAEQSPRAEDRLVRSLASHLNHLIRSNVMLTLARGLRPLREAAPGERLVGGSITSGLGRQTVQPSQIGCLQQDHHGPSNEALRNRGGSAASLWRRMYASICGRRQVHDPRPHPRREAA
jgi:hypothetical protein